jgi:hypothetical protein
MSGAAPEFRDKAVFLGWIAGLLLAGLLLWSLTQSLQARYLLRAVNRVLIFREDTRRLAAPLNVRSLSAAPLGVWYSMIDSDSAMFVFALMWDGMLIPCGALVTTEGQVTDLIPLSGSAGQLLDRIPQRIIEIYIRRVEAAAAERGR